MQFLASTGQNLKVLSKKLSVKLFQYICSFILFDLHNKKLCGGLAMPQKTSLLLQNMKEITHLILAIFTMKHNCVWISVAGKFLSGEAKSRKRDFFG